MTRNVGSLAEMAVILVEREVAIVEFLGAGLDRVLEKIEGTAKAEFGTYQDAAGPFEAWPELADATKDDRVAQGYPENEPLLREGDLRDSLGHERQGLEGAVGSTDERMVYHEFGTSKMPARPVLGPAAFRDKTAIEMLVGAAAVSGLIGADVARRLSPEFMGPLAGETVHESLGYDFATKD